MLAQTAVAVFTKVVFDVPLVYISRKMYQSIPAPVGDTMAKIYLGEYYRYMASDGRKFPRISLDVLVNYETNAIAHTKDMSEGGVCLITDKKMTVGKMLSLGFYLPNNVEIKAIGKVCWCRPASENLMESGVEFWDIGFDQKEAIRKILSDEQ